MRTIIILFAIIFHFNSCSESSKTDSKSKSATQNNLENLDGLNAMKRGDYSSAIDYFTVAIKREPNKSAIWFNRARCFEELQKYEEAINDFNEAIKLNNFKDGKIPNCYFGLGNCYGALKQYELSLNNYKISWEMKMSNESLLYNIIYLADLTSDSTTACEYAAKIDFENANPNYLNAIDSIIKKCNN